MKTDRLLWTMCSQCTMFLYIVADNNNHFFHPITPSKCVYICSALLVVISSFLNPHYSSSTFKWFCNRVSLEEMLCTQFVNAGLLCVNTISTIMLW